MGWLFVGWFGSRGKCPGVKTDGIVVSFSKMMPPTKTGSKVLCGGDYESSLMHKFGINAWKFPCLWLGTLAI